MSKITVVLKGAVVIDGEIKGAGETVEVTKAEAENLLARGKAALPADEEEAKAAAKPGKKAA